MGTQGSLCSRVSSVLFLTMYSSTAALTWSSQFKKQGKDWRMRFWQPLTAHFFLSPSLVCINRRQKRAKPKDLITYWRQLKLGTDSAWFWWHEPLTLARTSALTGTVAVAQVELVGTWVQVGASPLESEQTWVPGVPPPSTSPVTVGKKVYLPDLSFFIISNQNTHRTCMLGR